jgi:8-oxo-dGTP diphosphatase
MGLCYNFHMHGAFGIIFDNTKKQVLLVKRRDMPIWVLPGGHMEKDEQPEQTAIREVKEETGYQVEILKKVGKYSYNNSDKINYTYTCKIIGGKATLSNESKSIEYFDLDALPDLISPYAPKMIKDALLDSTKTLEYKFEGLSIAVKLKALSHPWTFFKYLLVRCGIHWNT